MTHPNPDEQARSAAEEEELGDWNGCLTGDCPHDTQRECFVYFYVAGAAWQAKRDAEEIGRLRAEGAIARERLGPAGCRILDEVRTGRDEIARVRAQLGRLTYELDKSRDSSVRRDRDLRAQLVIAREGLEMLEQYERGHEIYTIGSDDEPAAHVVARETLARLDEMGRGR